MKRFHKLFSVLGISLMLFVSACSQTRSGLGGRFEDVYLLNAVSLSGSNGSFDLQVNVTDNYAFLNVREITLLHSEHPIQVFGSVNGGQWDTLTDPFMAYSQRDYEIYPLNGMNIYDYRYLCVKSTIYSGNGYPRQAETGAGDDIACQMVQYPDLNEALQAMGYIY